MVQGRLRQKIPGDVSDIQKWHCELQLKHEPHHIWKAFPHPSPTTKVPRILGWLIICSSIPLVSLCSTLSGCQVLCWSRDIENSRVPVSRGTSLVADAGGMVLYGVLMPGWRGAVWYSLLS